MGTISKYVKRLNRCDPTLKAIYLYKKQHIDAKLSDCLLAHPNAVNHMWLARNQLTNKTGVKLARYLTASSTIESLGLSYNQFGKTTYLALAAALRVNSSLRELYLYNNQAVDRTRIDAAFAEALRLNPVRPNKSMWHLYSTSKDFKRLKNVAEKSTPPSMLEFLLCVHSKIEITETKKH